MADRFSALPIELQQKIALQRFQATFGPPVLHHDPSSGLTALRLNAWQRLVPPPPCEDLARGAVGADPQSGEELRDVEQGWDNPASDLLLLLHTQAVHVVEFDCVLKHPGTLEHIPYPDTCTLLLLEDLVNRLPPGPMRFLKSPTDVITDRDVEWRWKERAVARLWPAFKPAVCAFLFMQHSYVDEETRLLEETSEEEDEDIETHLIRIHLGLPWLSDDGGDEAE